MFIDIPGTDVIFFGIGLSSYPSPSICQVWGFWEVMGSLTFSLC